MTEQARKISLFFLCRQPPYSGSHGQSCLDLLLTAATFDQPVTLAFAGEGVYSLLADQDGSAIAAKDIARSLPALELYGVEHVMVELQALSARGMTKPNLVMPAEFTSTEELARAMAGADQVLLF